MQRTDARCLDWVPSLYSARFDIVSQTSGSAYLLRLRTAAKGAIAAVFVSSSGKLELRDDVTTVTTTSTTSVSRGAWHTLELYGNINGAPGQASVWLDGSPVSQLTGTQSLGANPIGYLQLGDTSTADQFDAVFDDVQARPTRRSSSHEEAVGMPARTARWSPGRLL